MGYKILIAAGGTGGHIYPAISIAEALKNQDQTNNILFVCQHKVGLEKEVFEKYNYNFKRVMASGLYGKSLKNRCIGFFNLVCGSFQSLFLLLRFNPKIIIGVGAYFSGPILLLAYLLGKKIFIQEQNVQPGITNRYLGKIAHLSFIPFEKSKHLFKNPIVVGNPIRKEIDALFQVEKKKSPILKILVLGGSQGAKVINQVFYDTIKELAEQNHQIEVHHQIGSSEYEDYKKKYQTIPHIQINCYDFVHHIEALYQDCNLIISRSGSIVYEFTAVGIASILIPISKSSGNHQLENAKTMQNHNAGFLIEEKDFNKDRLKKKIEKFINSKELALRMSKNAQSLYQGNAANQIVKEIYKYFSS